MIEKFVVLIGVEAVALDEKEIIRNGLMFSIRSQKMHYNSSCG